MIPSNIIILSPDRYRLDPFFIFPVIIPFIRKAATADKTRVISPPQRLFISIVNFTEGGCLAAYIRVMNFYLLPVSIFYDFT